MRILTLVLTFALVAPAMAMDLETEGQVRRLDAMINGMLKEVDSLQVEMRQLQRKNDALEKENKAMREELDAVNDNLLQTQNLDLSNLKAGQKQLYDMIPDLNWGAEKRNCQGIGNHQQTKIVPSPDGKHSLKYLCFDGRALHMGTELHEPISE